MIYPFDATFRELIEARCASFSRLPASLEGGLKPAAVAIAVTDADNAGDAAIILTRRSEVLRAHSGQWALPGGRCDTGETAAGAALRELYEELGITVAQSDVLGVLDDYETRSGYVIKPAVVWAGASPRFRPNPLEVASVHRIPLASIANAGAVSFISIPQSDRPVIRLRVGSGYIHAPTAAVIYQFLELLAGRTTRVKDFEQPLFAWR
jgi:8-oxo-dGTP pyrophosphatase MutT (NUDIX family)